MTTTPTSAVEAMARAMCKAPDRVMQDWPTEGGGRHQRFAWQSKAEAAQAALTALITLHPGIAEVIAGRAVVVPVEAEWLKAQRANILWCMHVIGPDDLHAARDYDDAARMVAELLAALAADGRSDVTCLPTVAVWPWGAEAHSRALAKTNAAPPAAADGEGA